MAASREGKSGHRLSHAATEWHLTRAMPKSEIAAHYFDGERSFARFYTSYAEDLLIWFTRRTLDPEAALDLTGETFAQAFLSRHRLRGGDEAAAAAWLYGIARNQLSRFWRKGGTESRAMRRLGLEREELAPSEQERLEERADLAALRETLATALDEVPADQREAVQLRVVQELTYAELAQRLGISEQNARARVSRGLRRLGDAIDLQAEVTSKELTTT